MKEELLRARAVTLKPVQPPSEHQSRSRTMENEDGRSPSGPGCSAEPGPISVVPAVPVSIPNAWPRFNLNREVAVKLTPRGLRIMKDRHNELRLIVPTLGAFKPPKTDEHGWTRFQLWTLIQELGQHISMGIAAPFETTIALDASAIEAAAAGETAQTGSTEGESAVAKPDAPTEAP